MSDDKVRLGGLWKNQTKGGDTYLSGGLGMGKILIFPNGYKKRDNDPDYVMYVAPGKRRDDGDTPPERDAYPASDAPAAEFTDNEIPF